MGGCHCSVNRRCVSIPKPLCNTPTTFLAPLYRASLFARADRFSVYRFFRKLQFTPPKMIFLVQLRTRNRGVHNDTVRLSCSAFLWHSPVFFIRQFLRPYNCLVYRVRVVNKTSGINEYSLTEHKPHSRGYKQYCRTFKTLIWSGEMWDFELLLGTDPHPFGSWVSSITTLTIQTCVFGHCRTIHEGKVRLNKLLQQSL